MLSLAHSYISELMSVRRNTFLIIQRCSLLLVSYNRTAFLSDNKINLLKVTTVFSLVTGLFCCCYFIGFNSLFSANYSDFYCVYGFIMISPLFKDILTFSVFRTVRSNVAYKNKTQLPLEKDVRDLKVFVGKP